MTETTLPLVGGREEASQQTQTQPPRKKHAKLFHKKSRTGCRRCRSRRVKCDEARPICSNCTRLDLECGYGPPSTTPTSEGDAVRIPAALSVENNLVESHGVLHLPETEARRKLELELFHHYMTETAPTLGTERSAQEFIGPALCRAALRSDAVLYGLCMLSALHKAYTSNFSEPQHMQHHSTYLNLALQSHHKHVARLDTDNVDDSCMVSSTLRVYAYVQLQRRDLRPYAPPIEWLRMSNTSTVVFRKALALIEKNPDSLSGKLTLEISHHLDEKRRLEHSDELLHLLRHQEPHELEEEWNDEVYHVYRRTLSCFGWVWKHRFDRHPPPGMSRRIHLFPMIVDSQFVDYVAQRRPRALVILAHYFTLLALHRDFWYVGAAGFREVRAIAAELPLAWQGMLSQPLEILQDPSLLCKIS
ncbi:N-terminal fungal transcription regulatory domain-containing protein [Trichoderma longibrachiatum]|uniref:N-terminal fungal transcription regulatory domain-containing protein n=1 Tax=Trichoderma longibrachiatum ATCC 18648 TaxID=983965 RepID=A0A2T4BR65_TRILO|nr:N-terminal fungal transcription regulatory domain-containing protein [Trichoderma longibrachiatum ATCC 18648]